MTFVQAWRADAAASTNSIAVTINPSAGNALVVWYNGENGTAGSVTCSDGGSTFVRTINDVQFDSGGAPGRHSAFYALSVAGGSRTLTISLPSNRPYRSVRVEEHSGLNSYIDVAALREQASPGTGTGGVQTNAINITSQPAWIIGFASNWGTGTPIPAVGTGVNNNGSGFDYFGDFARFGDRRVTATGNATLAFTAGTNTLHYSAAMAFLELPDEPDPGEGYDFFDQFDREDSATIGNDWVEKNAAAFAIANEQVTAATTSEGYHDNLVYRPTEEAFLNGTVTMEFTVPNDAVVGYPQILGRVAASTVATAGTLDAYMLFMENSDTDLVLARTRGTSFFTELDNDTAGTPLTESGRYRLRLEYMGTAPVVLAGYLEQWDVVEDEWTVLATVGYNDSAGNALTQAGTVGFSKYVEATYVYDNFGYIDAGGEPDPEPEPGDPTLSAWAAALSAVENSTRNAIILCVGDSTTAGHGATGSAMSNNARSMSWPTQLAALFTTVKASAASFFGTNGVEQGEGHTHNGYDSRIALPTGWTVTADGQRLSDRIFTPSSGSAPFVFTPGVSFDRVQVAYERFSGSPTFSVSVNEGASLGSTSNSGTPPPDIAYQTFIVPTLANSSATVEITPSGTGARLIGVRVYRSDEPEVSILNAGWWAGTTVEAAQDGDYSPLSGIRAIAPDLTIIFLGINDIWWAGTSAQEYADALNDLLDAALVGGSVLLIKPHRIGSVAQGTQDTFYETVDTVATVRDVPVLSLPDRWGTNAQATSAGFMDGDGTHLSGAGYSDVAEAVYEVIVEELPEPPPGIFSDDFERTNSASIGNGWVEKNPEAFSLVDGEVVSASTELNYWDNIVYRPLPEAFLDGSASVEFRLTGLAVGYPQVLVRVQPDTVEDSGELDAYLAFMEDTTAFRIGRTLGSSLYSVLASGTLSEELTASDRYRMSISVEGEATVSLTATMERWNSGTSAWVQIGTLNTTDSSGSRLQTAGTVGFGKSVDTYNIYDNFSYVSGDAPTAPGITDVDTDESITSTQTGWTITGTGFSSATVEIRQGTTVVGQTINSQNATTINCDTVFDSGATDLRYGSATLAVINGDEQEDTIAITIVPPSGRAYVDLTTPNTTAANRITATADLASGDQLEISNVVGGSIAIGDITVNADATFEVDETVTAFDVRAWDASDSTWGVVGTQTVTDITEASLDVTESPDTANVSIGTLVTGTLSATEGRDAAAFTVELLRVASMGATEPRDVLNASVDVLVISTFAVTEPSDSIAASSYLITSLVVNAVEAVDTASITSDALISVNLNITEARDSFSASIGRQLNILIDVTETVDVVALSVDNIATGMLSSVESTDQLVAAVEHLAIAAMGVIESRDVFSGTIGSTAFLNFSAVEPTDTIDVSVDLINAVELSVTEQSDTLASNVNVVITYVLTATEPNDIASIFLDGPATLSIELIEQADTISILIESAGLRMDAIEPLDTFSSSIENIRSLLVGLVEGSDTPSITFETGYVYSEEWASAIALAHRMINKKGRFANVQRLATTVTDPSKPWKGTSPATIAQSVRSKMVFLIHEGRRDLGYYGVDEEMLRRVEQIVLIAPGPVDLTNFNAIEDGSVRYIVEWQRVLRPGDSSILYVFGVKR